jgi:hypothetical protein
MRTRPLQLRNLLGWCRFTFLAATAVGLVRLGYVAWSTRPLTVTYTKAPSLASERTEEDGTSLLSPRGLSRDVIERLMRSPTPLPSELLEQELAPGVASVTIPKKPAVTRVYVAIHEGPARTEIRMNGITLGHTPFVGEITCKHGEPLEFVLIPPKGVPRRSRHVCDRTEITLTLDTK